MALRKPDLYTLDEYLKLKEITNQPYEYINGEVIRFWSPTTDRQKIALSLGIKLKEYFKKTNYTVVFLPCYVSLYKEDIIGTQIVIPDISVICDKFEFNESDYKGIPTIIIEILNSSVQDDTIKKFNLYLKYGVREYWIINPEDRNFQVYTYDIINKSYVLFIQEPYKELRSKLFPDLVVNMEEIYEEI